MHAITRSCVLFLWIHTLTFVKSQDCTLNQFLNGPLYDSNFDTTDLKDSYPGGKQVRVGCNVGYSGFFKLVCIEGKWESRGSKCEPRSCGHPGDAQFAEFRLDKGDDFVFGSQVVYTCHKGYQMVSRTNYRRCMAEGWDGVVPVCEAQQCPVVHVDDNVLVNGDPEEATYGNVVRFSCKSNTEILSGPSEIFCDENGQWSDEPAKCKAIKCTVPTIQNGRVLGPIKEYKEHEILHFECDPLYKRVNDRDSKCTKLGSGAEWSPTPLCDLIRCEREQRVAGTTFDPLYKNRFLPGETLRVTCGQKYWISVPQKTSEVTTCQENGEWSIRPICREVTCSDPQDPHVNSWYRSWRQQISKLDDTANYRCRRGYKSPDHNSQATCTRDGWTPNPLCQVITCGRRDVLNADTEDKDKQTYIYGEKVHYVCKHGFKGRLTLTCGDGGLTGNQECTVITCGRRDVLNADTEDKNKQTYIYGEKVHYVCKDGFKGRLTLTCGDRGLTGNQECTATTGCGKADIPHGFTVSLGDTLYYTCDEGYKLFTKGWWSEAKCIDRVWSPLGQCINKTSCGELPVIPNVEMTYQRVYGHNESVQIQCKAGYSAQPDSLTCNEGKWSTSGISLKTICTATAKHCSAPPKVANAVVTASYQKEYLSDSDVTYECRNKYQLEGGDKLRCIDGKWEKKNIHCIHYCVNEKRQTVTFTPNKEKYMNEDVIEYQCVETDIIGTARCVNGEWNEIMECEKKCEVTGIPRGVLYDPPDNELRKGQNLTFSCRNLRNHFLHGNAVVECLADGQWSHPFPTCGPAVGCGRPPLLADGDIKESLQYQYEHNDRVEYICQRYYTMEGEPFQTCNNGKWTGQMRCLKPCTVTEGDMSQRNIAFRFTDKYKLYSAHNDIIEFRCTRGRHVGTVSMRQTCVDGEISLPTCQ